MGAEFKSHFSQLRQMAGLSVEQAAKRLRTSLPRAYKLEEGLVGLTLRQQNILEKLIQRPKVGKQSEPKFTYYDFFAGGGMAGVGLGPRWTSTFANDIDATKAAAYRAYHSGKSLIVGDIRQINATQLPDRADLAWASFPCQDLSLAGNGAGLRSERSGLFFPFWKLICALDKDGRAPRSIIIENVYGLLTADNGQDFSTIASFFSGRGYRFGAVIVDSIKFVPQSRPRVFIIGVHKDVVISPSLIAKVPSPAWHPKALRHAYSLLSKAAASKWVWWNLPSPPQRKKTLIDVVEDASGTPGWHTPQETKYLLSLMDSVNLEKVAEAKRSGVAKVGAVYRRMRPDGAGRVQRAEVRFDGVAGCLRTPNGGSSRQTLLFVNGKNMRSRLLSSREAARLMGLPDSYPLPERYNDAYHLFGDGVVAPVVRHLAKHIINPLLGAPANFKIVSTSKAA